MHPFIVQTNSDVPIYRQLIDQVRRMAASGQLTPGQRLPSVRQLAEELAVNPMTISKAYSQLETEGLLVRQRGIGMALKSSTGNAEELLNPAVTELVRQAKQLQLTQAAVIQQLQSVWKETDHE